MPARITYISRFARSVNGSDWNVKIDRPESGHDFPDANSIIRVTKRNGKSSYVRVGDLLVDGDGSRTYAVAASARIPSELAGKYLKSNLVYINPRRYGTHGYRSFEIIRSAENKTVHIDDFLYLGGRLKDLRWDRGRFRVSVLDTRITLDIPDQETEETPKPVDDEGNEIVDEPTDEELNELPEAEEAEEEEIERPVFDTEKGEHLPAVFQRIFELGTIGQNILLVGPSGSGKTFLSKKLSEKLGRSFAAQSCSAGMSESQLAGWLLPVKDAGTFAYVPSAFVRLYEEGGVFLLDEIDAADENTLIFINAALANGEFYLPQRFDNPQVKRHPDFVAIAAANTFGLGEDNVYTGRTQLDGATLDRFRAGVIFVDYDPKVEEALSDSKVLSWGRKVRRVIELHKLDRILSTRVLVDFTKQKRELGYTITEMEASYFADWSEDERLLAA